MGSCLPAELNRNLIQRLQQPRQTAVGPNEKSVLLAEAASKSPFPFRFPGCPLVFHVSKSVSLRSDKTLSHFSLCSALRTV